MLGKAVSLLAIALQMPSHDLFEDALAARLDRVAVARDQPIEIPTRNCATAAPKPLPIALASHVPNEPLLPNSRARCILKAGEELGQQTIRSRHARPRVLFVRRQVEDHVSRDEGPVGPMVKHKFLVRMATDIFVVKFTVKVRVDSQTGLVLHRKDPGEFGAGRGRVCFALLRQTFDAD